MVGGAKRKREGEAPASGRLAKLNSRMSALAGFGSFVDKTVVPYVSIASSHWKNPCLLSKETCQSPFSYHHVLPLTDNASEFESRVSQQQISGNLDDAEGGFDAIMQAAVCKVRGHQWYSRGMLRVAGSGVPCLRVHAHPFMYMYIGLTPNSSKHRPMIILCVYV